MRSAGIEPMLQVVDHLYGRFKILTYAAAAVSNEGMPVC